MKCNIPQNQKHERKMTFEERAKLFPLVHSAMVKSILNADNIESEGDTDEQNDR